MKYAPNQKICLWKVEIVRESTLMVIKEVIVTITEVKSGVIGEISGKPVPFQSVLGVGDDSQVYEKHWLWWPESPVDCDFDSQWTDHVDCVTEKVWTPVEAVYIYNEIASSRCARGALSLFDTQGLPIVPKGDVQFCTEHDEFVHYREMCSWCCMDNLVRRRVAMAGRKNK